jgi:hypothetical protein
VIFFCITPFLYLYAQQVSHEQINTQVAVNTTRLGEIEKKLDVIRLWELDHDKERSSEEVSLTNRLTGVEITVAHHEHLIWLFGGIVLTFMTREVLSPLLKRRVKEA